jgi:hypothetical protein
MPGQEFQDIEKNNDNGRERMGYSEARAKPTHAEHPWYECCQTGTEYQLRSKVGVHAHVEDAI